MTKRAPRKQFLLCIRNEAYPASLEVRKIYEQLPDDLAATKGLVRVIDESGEDYLYPAALFITVELPQATVKVLLAAS